jgi:hypothetical protein
MKKIILLTSILLALLATPRAWAWSYSDGDLLLVFRGGLYDIEYDLGSVSNLLGQTNGYTTTITNWNPSVVTGLFGPNLAGVNVVLLAVTSSTNASPTAWLSGAEPDTTAYNPASGAWSSSLYSIIDAVGNKPISPFYVTAAAVTPTNAYAIQIGGVDAGATYDYIVSGGTFQGIPTLGGHTPFTVQQTIPGSFDFWGIGDASGSPDQLIGTFTITTSGALTFVAGPRSSTITEVNHSGNVSSVQFTTTVGNHYSVGYTNRLSKAAAWPVDVNTLVGDGRIDTINHTNNNQNAEFYRINTR